MDPMTPYRVSTITATGSVNTEINLDIFYDALTICDDADEEGVVYAEYGKKKSDTVYKGFCKKFLVNKRKVSTTSKRFDNQVTIVYKKTEVGFVSLLNIKIFKNGNVQITGIKYIEQGHQMIDRLINLLRGVHDPEIMKNPEDLCNKNYSICLINSDFKIGFPIKRELLYKVFTTTYENDCSFEPCIYPGVKIEYFFNRLNAITPGGICGCTKQCITGKGSGKVDGQCKKITIAVFQSGCVIITGAQSHEQINEAYAFIRGVLLKHQHEIEKKNMVPLPEELPRKVILINKKNIKYLVVDA
jgi:TATA-box binding protein (TBP) (component of TFIID and TFIIIB)